MSSIALPKTLIIAAGLLLIPITMDSASGQREVAGNNLSLDIYLYNTGNTLIAGYVDNIEGLTFLMPARYTPNYTSKYMFDHQLYAWTDTLTSKQGKAWRLMFSPLGLYDDYHVVFHLPGNLMLGRINISKGLSYLVLASNDSLVVDVQGYSVRDPTISVEYQQLLEEHPPDDININSSSYNNSSFNRLPIVGAMFIIAVGLAFVFVITRRKDKLQPKEMDPPEAAKPCGPLESIDDNQQADINNEEKELNGATLLMEPQTESVSKTIEVSGEMKAVMETLTPRERAILETLIKHGGRMTQLEIRYETNSPKSSVAMILISLEKRKLITKKEWGRTNVVELSEWFLSRK